MEGLRHFQHSGLKNYLKIGKFRKIGIFQQLFWKFRLIISEKNMSIPKIEKKHLNIGCFCSQKLEFFFKVLDDGEKFFQVYSWIPSNFDLISRMPSAILYLRIFPFFRLARPVHFWCPETSNSYEFTRIFVFLICRFGFTEEFFAKVSSSLTIALAYGERLEP